MPVYKGEKKLIETTQTVELSGAEVEEAIRRYLNIHGGADFSLRFTIPGGGDWSREVMEADEFSDITAKITEKEIRGG